MIQEQIKLNRSVKIIQVYRHIHVFGKDNKSSAERKIVNSWHPINSYSGYFSKGNLYLPEINFFNEKCLNCDIILLVDDNPTSINTENEYIYFLNLSHPKRWAIFDLQLKENLELHLRYDHFHIGEPARDDYKLCELKPHMAIEVQINGKLDFSLTSRKARSYKEQFYIFDFLGEVDKIMMIKSPHSPYTKVIPSKRKTINLLKPLW